MLLLLGAEVLMTGLAGVGDLLKCRLPILSCAVTERCGERVGDTLEVLGIAGEAVPLLPDGGKRLALSAFAPLRKQLMDLLGGGAAIAGRFGGLGGVEGRLALGPVPDHVDRRLRPLRAFRHPAA